MNCYRCTTPIPNESTFCLHCGAQVSDPTGSGPKAAWLDEAAARELEELLRGDTADEYEIEREIGRGGMGVVYLATEVHLARQVAIKVLPPDLTFGKGAVERFKREAKTAAALDHPNIIPIYRITAGGRLFWYAMKYLEGESLADTLVQKKRLSLDGTIEILQQVGDALDYAHERKVIHRDAKPSNVILDRKGRVTVTDFGIAKQLEGGSQTASGAVIGTPYYMSGEQCRGQMLTGAADQYSVGVMAYHMLSGQVPFEGDSVVDILQKQCNEPAPPLEVLRPGLPREVYRAVERAMAKQPFERFASVAAFVNALKRPTEASTLRLPTAVAVPSTGPWRRARAWILGSVAAAVAIAGLGVAASLWQADRPPAQQAAPVPQAPVTAPTPLASDSARSQTTPPAATRPQPAFQKPAVVRPGMLVVRTEGGWARIFIDGAFRREGTSFGDTVAASTHRLHLEREGYQPVDTIVVVRPSERVIVRITMRREGT